MRAARNIALAGLGGWGRNIFRNFHAMGVLRAVCDSNGPLLEGYRRRYRSLACTTGLQDLLADDGVRAVALATPAATHFDLAQKALRAGKDVFVEKPLALRAAEGEKLVRLAKRKKRILMVGHVLNYHPAVGALKDLLSSGKLGSIQYVYSNRLNLGKLRTEENILWSFAPHDISVMLQLVGEDPVRVTAFGDDCLRRGIYDTTLTSLDFPGGIKGHVFVSWLHPYKEQKLIVVGSRAMAVFDDVGREKLLLYPHAIEWEDGKAPVARKADFVPVPVAAREPLRAELRHFVNCIRTRSAPLTDGAEGLRVLRVLEQAEESLRSKSFLSPPGVFVHETAAVDPGVTVGAGTKVWHYAHLLRDAKIGRNCTLGQNVAVGPRVTVGDNVKIQNNVSVYEGVTLEDGVFCGPSMVFTNVINPRSEIPRMGEKRDTLVRRGATIGANATVLCGLVIGRWSLVGAGAVVTRDVPDYAIVAGNPARRAGWVCRCGVKLPAVKRKASCRDCGRSYSLAKGRLVPAGGER